MSSFMSGVTNVLERLLILIVLIGACTDPKTIRFHSQIRRESCGIIIFISSHRDVSRWCLWNLLIIKTLLDK